jgi:hypothetical protein
VNSKLQLRFKTTKIAKLKFELAVPFPSMIGDAYCAETVVTQASSAYVLLAMADVADAAAVAEGGEPIICPVADPMAMHQRQPQRLLRCN